MSRPALILTSRSALDQALADAKALRASAEKLATELEALITGGYELTRGLPEAGEQTEDQDERAS